MKRTLLVISFATLLLAGQPVSTLAMSWELPSSEALADDERVTISVSEQTVLVSGAQGERLEVVSLTGKVVKTIVIDSASQRIELNLPKGCYILKVGKVARKISVR